MSDVKRYKLRAGMPDTAVLFLPDEVVSAADFDALRAELAAIKGHSGFDYSIRTQSTNRIPVPSQEIHFNSKDQLPPVDTPLLVLFDNQVVRARRPNFVERKGADLEFILVDGRTISGRLPWTYP